MKTLEDNTIKKRYWVAWGITTVLGFFVLLMQLGSYNSRSICSPVVGCGYEVPLGLTILISFFLLITRAFRKKKVHIVVFFIFLVANIGGSLTPLGDPPLFLGFLKGVDFFWTTTMMFKPMLLMATILLIMFYFLKLYIFYNLRLV